MRIHCWSFQVTLGNTWHRWKHLTLVCLWSVPTYRLTIITTDPMSLEKQIDASLGAEDMDWEQIAFCMLILTLPFASLLVIRSHRTMITQTRFVSSANGLVQKRMRKSNPPLSHIVFLKMNIKERPIPSFLLVSFSFTCWFTK